MTDLQKRDERFDDACRRVGRFLYHYAIMEQALDSAIGKLLGLEGGAVDIVCANIPVAKKVEVLFSSEKFLGAKPTSERAGLLKKTRSGIMKLNDQRVIVAHCPFGAASNGGVSFRRVVTRGELKVLTVDISPEELDRLCAEAVEVAAAVDRVAEEMEPFVPSLDFSDPRNSGYLMLFT